MPSAVFLWQVCVGPRIRQDPTIQSVLFVFLNRCCLPFQRPTRRFKRQIEAPSKVDRSLSIFESPRGNLSHSKPAGGRDAFNTGDVAAGRDINPVSLGRIPV